MSKITFSDLSLPLQLAILLAWITGSLLIVSFIIGFIGGATGTW